jgi:Kef-type K+ transport system membrane component KefB
VTAARNVGLVLLLAALVAFLPGGGTAAAVIGGVLSTLILVSFVLLGVRYYREHRIDLVSLGDRWRALLYGSIGAIVLVMAARMQLWQTSAGALLWAAVMGAAAYSLYLVWRHSREY